MYSKQVAVGICKDYSIDYQKSLATFSFYKHTFDKPIFQIIKYYSNKYNVKPDYIVKQNKKIIENSKSLLNIINRLDKKFNLYKKLKRGSLNMNRDNLKN